MTQPEVPTSTSLVAGKYQLVAMIGRGGMGSVWEARHASLGTRFAIKFIEAEYADSQEARSRFDKEARAAATIQSKHAIQIYDHGVTEDGKPYIVMELLQGEPLDKRIERLGRLTLQDTARILHQVCRGLARAHERGIVHRDLKPENIFIVRTTEDDDEIAKVLDFGIAKIQSSTTNPAITSSTKTGAVLGTPFYMSPEQARGLRNVDHRTDVWSLGVIAYKCVTGKLPFDGESVGDLLVKICTAPVPLPSQSLAGLPPAFDAWFLRALEREPDRRYATVTELAEQLAFVAGLGLRGSVASGPGGHSNVSTVAAGVGSGGGPMATPQHVGPYGSNPSYAPTATPPPGAMTAAPFTSSQPVPGVPSRSKWIVGVAAVAVGIGAAVTGGIMIKQRHDAAAQNGVGLTSAPSTDPSALDGKPGDTKPSEAKNADKGVDPLADARDAGTNPATATSVTSPPSTAATSTPVVTAGGKTATLAGKTPTTGAAKPPKTADKPPPLPPANTQPVVATPPPTPPPATPPPAPATPAKKPNKNDPGY